MRAFNFSNSKELALPLGATNEFEGSEASTIFEKMTPVDVCTLSMMKWNEMEPSNRGPIGPIGVQ